MLLAELLHVVACQNGYDHQFVEEDECSSLKLASNVCLVSSTLAYQKTAGHCTPCTYF